MIRRNSLRTRMASQFGSRISVNTDDNFFLTLVKIENLLTGYAHTQLEDLTDLLENLPYLDAMNLEYQKKFGYSLDEEGFVSSIEGQINIALKNIIKEHLLKLKLGKYKGQY